MGLPGSMGCGKGMIRAKAPKKHTSRAKALIDFIATYGTAEVVP
jgi:hypothetical protein